MNQQRVEKLIDRGTFTGISGSRHRGKDERRLAQLGKKQVLKVRHDSRRGP